MDGLIGGQYEMRILIHVLTHTPRGRADSSYKLTSARPAGLIALNSPAQTSRLLVGRFYGLRWSRQTTAAV